MWQILMRGQIVNAARYALFPVSIVLGALGLQLENIFNKDKNIRDNKDFPSAFDRRSERQLNELGEQLSK